jgi:phage FluMu gp28-like protein
MDSPRRAATLEPRAAIATAKHPAVPLTDYQKAAILDRARFRFRLQARQTGKSFGESLDGVLNAVETKQNWVWLSSGERASKDLIEKGAMHARAIGAACEVLTEEYKIEDQHFTGHTLKLPGAKIVGLPANPATARGHSANILLDEFAFHKDSRAIWTALFPTITRGFRITIATTPMGKSNQAFKLWTDWSQRMDSGDRHYSCRKVTIFDAIAGGLVLRDHEGKLCTPEQLREALGDDEAWQQEYLCEFLDEATAWLSHDLIASVEVEDLALAPNWAARLVEEATEQHREFLATKRMPDLDPQLLADLRHVEPIYGGMDIGRRRDLTVIWPMVQVAAILRALAVIELARQPFFVQQRILFHLLDLPGMRRCCIDSTGMGTQLAESAQERFGAWKVEAVDFSVGSKEALAGAIKQRVEDRGLAIPISATIRNSLHSVKRIQTTTGHFRFDAERSESTGHADHFWALALACQAASTPGVVMEHQSTGQTRVSARAYEAGGGQAAGSEREFLHAGVRRAASKAADRGPKGF